MSLDLNSTSIEYKDKKVIIKSIPKDGENISVFMRPGDEVVFDIEGFDSDALEYILVGGDIVVSFANEGVLTFPSLGLMGFSSNPPQFSLGGNKSISVDNILSKIQEINELPITSVDASFTVTTSNKDEDEVPLYNQEDRVDEADNGSGTGQAQVIVIPQTQSFSDTQSKRENFTHTEQNDAISNFTSNLESTSRSTPPQSAYTNPYSRYTRPNDFDAYKPDEEMIPKPDEEMIPKPDEEMIPKPDEEMIPKPDEEMMPENDFTDYFPENDFDGYGDGDGDGEGEGVPNFGFKATAHQVRYSETTNDEGQVEILGGGGSVLGYENASITNQFEPETIDMSARSEDMVIRAEDFTYFSDTPSSLTGINNITFKDLSKGQSVTVDGLKLTATDEISAAEIATAFASLSAGATTGNVVTNGDWSGALSTGWSSDPLLLNTVTFTSQTPTEDVIDLTVSDSQEATAPTLVTVLDKQGNETTTETYTITFKDLVAGQSVTIDGLTLTATDNISAAEVAAAFASIDASGTGNSIAGGFWDGALSADWASGVAVAANSAVTFKSTEENSDISAFEANSAGLTIDAPDDLEIVATQGVDETTTESYDITFQDLIAGQSVTIDGLTLTATDAISAADVAAAFESLVAGATEGNVVAGTWDGELSAEWASSEATDATVTFTSQTEKTDVQDLVTTSKGSTINTAQEIEVTSSQDKEDAYLSRVLRFEPQMPEGFYVDSFSIEGLPTGVTILDKDANEITGSNITRDNMLFKNELGEVIEYDSVDFLTSFKSLEFTIKYPNDISDPFNASITANYKVDEAYAHSVTEPEESYTNEYTFALKDITSASDYTYNKSDFKNGLDEGFILSKEPNYNIIKDGSGDSTIYGGTVRDVVYDGAGDDKIYLSAADDLVYGGSGTNYIYGDTDNDSLDAKKHTGEDTVSYEEVQSFGTSEVELLRTEGVLTPEDGKKLSGNYEVKDENDVIIPNSLDIDMLASHKGVYVDLEGVHIDSLDIDVNGDGSIDENDKINAISKFANREERFTYDDDGYAVDTTIGKTITFISETPNAEVEDIAVVISPTAPSVASTQGVDETTTESYDITFQDLIAGQSVTIDGLTLTATDAISAADVAAAFESLVAGATEGNVVAGTWDGELSAEWASSEATDATVTFTSQTEKTDVEDITIASAGVSGVDTSAVDVTIAQGSSDIDTKQSEKATIVFKDLIDGQSLSIGGLTLTADGANISAANVAAGFANLSAGAIEGNSIENGTWSGELSSFSSGELESGLSSIQAIGYDIYEDIENINGSNYNDTIYGNDNKDNVLSGLGGNDTIDGRGGDNKLYGGDGFDTLISGSGKDFIDGGADTDTVSYVNMDDDKGVTVRLDRPNGEEEDYAGYYVDANGDYVAEPVDDGSFVIKDKIINVEDITGSKYNDTIYGSSSTNYIDGGEGDDRIFAGGGYDFIDGGAGSDWITYKPSDYDANVANPNFMQVFQGITVDLNASDFVMVKETTTGTLIDLIKNVEKISATDGADVIYGSNSADEEFWGWGGDDTLYGRGGNDILHGGSGDDHIRPGRGVDYSDGGSGVDFLHLYDDALRSKSVQQIRLSDEVGKVGTVQYSTDNGNNWNDGYLTPESHNNNSEYDSDIFNIDNLSKADNIEGLHGSYYDDYIIGNSQDNRFIAHNGDDEIYGMDGDDFIRGGNGKDIIYGGDGDDILYGDGDDDIIEGGDGDDTIYGHSVHNKNATNNDTIDGGTGNNTLNYNSSAYAFVLDMSDVVDDYATVDFSASLPTSHSQNNTGDANSFNDKIKNIQNIHGSRGADHITGDDSANIINGWWGADTIYGGAGNDILYGGVHVDIIYGGDGDDYINLDQYSDTDERVHGQHNEYAYGGAGDDTIVSQGGSDYLYGEAGDDTFIVNYRPHELHGGTGRDTLTLGDTYLYLRNSDIQGLEELNVGSGRTYFNRDQFFDDNAFDKITGDDNSQLFIYGSNGVDDNYDLSSLDLSGYSGMLNFYAYNGTDSLKIGANQDINMNEYYYNTFEEIEVGANSSLNIEAYADNGRSYYVHRDFSNVDVSSDINVTGGAGNDTFYANYEALLAGKLNIDGGNGSDIVDLRTTQTNSSTINLNDAGMFSNIETLRLTNNDTRTNDIEIDAEVMRSWFNGDEFTLDLYNNTQGDKVIINNTKGDDMTGFEIGQTYDITLDDDSTFTMQVV
ncbi:hypothetical protein M947_10730 [Sulfurimonas hongkongensis]|uniref:Uncharacterized protein n=1 Tax=Sulfurimonas hongkongensis TaxID=1172190 RepID=T0KM63_9BACT|nr:calcium-binding protein [Sulfurimonas hongkongensis]EQB34473.1 hypothetical protein M947_10730 [Sulfurimonas hongkongensis]